MNGFTKIKLEKNRVKYALLTDDSIPSRVKCRPDPVFLITAIIRGHQYGKNKKVQIDGAGCVFEGEFKGKNYKKILKVVKCF